MNANLKTIFEGKLPHPRILTVERLFELVKDGGIKAFIATLTVLFLGSIALEIVGSIVRDHIPSLPPIFKPQLEVPTQHSAWERIGSSMIAYRSYMLFGIFFVFITGTRLAAYSQDQRIRKTAAWLLKHYRKISNHWFGSIVGNAFYASVMVIVLAFANFYNVDRWIINLAVEVAQPVLDQAGKIIFGNSIMAHVNAWVSWYDHNQAKFTFWVLYLAAIADDIGLPNYKTLIRSIWQYLNNRQKINVSNLQ